MKDRYLTKTGIITLHKTRYNTVILEIGKKIMVTIDDEGTIYIWKDMMKKAGNRKTYYNQRAWRFSLKPSWKRKGLQHES